MASHKAFNSMMEEFFNELIETIPEEKSLKLEKAKFKTLKKANPKKICEAFMEEVSPYTQHISKRDESALLKSDIDFLKKIHINNWWTKISVNSRDAIWQYLNTLIMLGTTITSIPSEMLKTIESVAEQCASGMDSGSGQPDMGQLFAGLQSMMGNMPLGDLNKE